jgi:hypothetical protein
MTSETILKAYAFASQCNYAEAERMLKADPDALNTPHGVDLYARILYAAGHIDSARQVWEELTRSFPDYEPAHKALAASQSPMQFSQCMVDRNLLTRKIGFACVVVAVVGIAFIGKLCQKESVPPSPEPPKVIAETTISGKINGRVLASLRDGFLTNLTDEAVLVISGGSGKYVTDRQRKLAVIADCIREEAKIPFSKMYFQPASESTDEIFLHIVPAWTGRTVSEQ